MEMIEGLYFADGCIKTVFPISSSVIKKQYQDNQDRDKKYVTRFFYRLTATKADNQRAKVTKKRNFIQK